MTDDHPTQPEPSENDAPVITDKVDAAEPTNPWKLTPEEKEEVFRAVRELQDEGVLDNQPD